jgi:hypothetical protein
MEHRAGYIRLNGASCRLAMRPGAIIRTLERSDVATQGRVSAVFRGRYGRGADPGGVRRRSGADPGGVAEAQCWDPGGVRRWSGGIPGGVRKRSGGGGGGGAQAQWRGSHWGARAEMKCPRSGVSAGYYCSVSVRFVLVAAAGAAVMGGRDG